MQRIVLASNNAGKLAELQAMFAPLGVELVKQGDLNISEADEPFHTFVENALAKARHASRYAGLPAVADDAGLCVDAFGGQPGVDTAYYATRFGYPKGDDNNVTALLEQMQGLTNRPGVLPAHALAERIISECSKQTLMFQGAAVKFTISIGVASYNMSSADEFIAKASGNLAQARRDGGNRVVMN